jgi:hypothetical protein
MNFAGYAWNPDGEVPSHRCNKYQDKGPISAPRPFQPDDTRRINDSELNLQDQSIALPPMEFRDILAFRRFGHYHARCVHHLNSRTAEQKSKEEMTQSRLWWVLREATTEEKVNVWIEHAQRARSWAREVLIWSYPYAYFLGREDLRLGLFEAVQANLELYNEALGQVFAGYISNLEGLSKFERLVEGLERQIDLLLSDVEQYDCSN